MQQRNPPPSLLSAIFSFPRMLWLLFGGFPFVTSGSGNGRYITGTPRFRSPFTIHEHREYPNRKTSAQGISQNFDEFWIKFDSDCGNSRAGQVQMDLTNNTTKCCWNTPIESKLKGKVTPWKLLLQDLIPPSKRVPSSSWGRERELANNVWTEFAIEVAATHFQRCTEQWVQISEFKMLSGGVLQSCYNFEKNLQWLLSKPALDKIQGQAWIEYHFSEFCCAHGFLKSGK